MTIPATPNAGTADPNPLVTYTQYQQVTGDTTTAEADWDAALDDALDLFQRRTRRTLLYAQYTERLYLYANGTVFPSATPLDVTKGVQSPNGAPPEDVGVFQGNGIWVGWYVPLPSLPMWEGVVPPQTDITYWGGWTGPSGPGPYLPTSIKRVLARIAWYALHPVTMAGLPAGAKSISVAGVSAAGDLSFMVDSDTRLRKDIVRWRHPHARGWDAQTTGDTVTVDSGSQVVDGGTP